MELGHSLAGVFATAGRAEDVVLHVVVGETYDVATRTATRPTEAYPIPGALVRDVKMRDRRTFDTDIAGRVQFMVTIPGQALPSDVTPHRRDQLVVSDVTYEVLDVRHAGFRARADLFVLAVGGPARVDP